METHNQKIVPYLWFDNQAEEAVDFYINGLEESRKGNVVAYTEIGQEQHGQEPGSVMTIEFEVLGFKMVALNGGPFFEFNPSISFFVICRDQEEIRAYWNHFSQGAKILMPLESYDWSESYGWLQDKYGVSWHFMVEEPVVTVDPIHPMLLFTGQRHGQSEEAMKFYTSIFDNAEIEGILYYGKENPYAKGKVQHAQFLLEGQGFMTMDSGEEYDFAFNESISFLINCVNQEEIDYYWNKLTQKGEEQPCGWLKDRFGISWQVTPKNLDQLLGDGQSTESKKAIETFFKMKKIEIQKLQEVKSGRSQ